MGNKCDCKGEIAVPTNVAQRFADHHGMPVSFTDKRERNTDVMQHVRIFNFALVGFNLCHHTVG